MKADLRGFDYPLEQRRRSTRWRLAALRSELGAARRRLEALEQERAGLEALLRPSQGMPAAISAATLAQRQRQLRYLADLHRRRAGLQAQIDAAGAEIDRLRSAAACCLKELDALDEHRRDALADYTVEQSRRERAESDRQWLAARARSS